MSDPVPPPDVQEVVRRLEEANTELARGEEQFRLLIAGVTDYAIFMLDPQGRVCTWNAGAERIKGYTTQQIIGKHFSQFYEPADIAAGKPERELETAAERGTFEEEGWRVRSDGSRFWANVVITAIRDGKGTLAGYTKITRDLTLRREAEEASRRSEQHARALFEYSPDAILVTDATGKIVEVNAQVLKYFGFDRVELLGQRVEMLVPERLRAAHPKLREDYARKPHARAMGAGLELYGRRKDGSEFPVDIMLGPVEGPAGPVILAVIRDLSQKKQDEEALRRTQLEKQYLEEELNTEYRFAEIIGESRGLRRVLKQVESVAREDATVLLLGETGTGKELVARAVHEMSRRRERTFVKLNCSAIPAGLLESELFGHERGAFTGAISRKVGRLELAHEGTLFLDEIGDLPLELQPKILRALQEREFERLGGTTTIPVNVRLIAATNRDLAKMVADREFRSDLYYRLKVFPIEIPPLRERREDIPVLVNYFVHKHATRMNREIATIPAETMRALTAWSWPGNVRELENFMERAVILTRGSVLRVPLGELESPGERTSDTADDADTSLGNAERQHILRVLREAKGMIGGAHGAAKQLGLKRTTLNSKLKKLGIKRKDYI